MHFKSSETRYSACGTWASSFTSTRNKSEVTCGSCKKTNVFKTFPDTILAEKWQNAMPEEGFYWVAEYRNSPPDVAYSDGDDWLTSSCCNSDFDEYPVAWFARIEPPTW